MRSLPDSPYVSILKDLDQESLKQLGENRQFLR